jgi:cell division septation protein DedD
MEQSMRDLDRLQEQDPDERDRHIGVWLVFAITILGLFFAVFLAWQRATPKADEADPLDQLVQNGQKGSAQAPRGRDAGSEIKAGPALDPTKLTFERSLTGEEDRPEVIAALAAAAREEEELADDGHDAHDGHDDAAEDAPTKGSRVAPLPKVPILPPSSAQIPAGLTVSAAGSKLEKSARHDPLVAAAMPKAHSAHTRASSGSAGEYILQVMSYEEKTDADAFASALRDRGHEAFVAAVNVEGRGRTYRVRIGPFKSKGAAESYRHDFEERERMNTIVVRRDEE